MRSRSDTGSYRILSDESVSFSHGFSQVNCAKPRSGNRLNGFLPPHTSDHPADGVCRKKYSVVLCVSLRASVVNVFPGNFTTETPSITEFAQRNSFFRQTPE